MRTPQLLLACLVFFACAPTGVDNADLVEVTVRLKLAGDRDVGATPGRVWVFIDSQPVARALAFPDFGEPCVLATTPVSTCTFSAPRSSYVSLLASEPDPAVVVRYALKSPQDTVRDGRYVEFTGWTDDMPSFWRVCDIAVMPSDTCIESFGMAAVEAMACARPVVVTENGALPELVDDGITGFVVSPRDVGALADQEPA